MIARTRRRPQIKYPQMTIAAHRTQYAGAMWAKFCRVCTTMRRQRGQTSICIRIPDLYRAIPATREERVLGDEVPMYGEDFAGMLLPCCDWEVGERDVEELYGAVAAGSQELAFVCFRPGTVEEGVLSIEPARALCVSGCVLLVECPCEDRGG